MRRNSHDWGWDNAPTPARQEEPACTAAEAATLPPPRNRTYTSQEVNAALERINCHNHLRSTFAQAIYPFDPALYHTKSEWKKKAGTQVCTDINNNVPLHVALVKAGYRPRTMGYTVEQLALLLEHYGKLLP